MASPPPSPSKKSSKKKRKALVSSEHRSDEDATATRASAPPPPRAPTTIRVTPRRTNVALLYGLSSFALAHFGTIVVALGAVAGWFVLAWLQGSLHSLVSSILATPYRLLAHRPSLAFPWQSLNLTSSLAPVVSIYCATVGVGCKRDGEDVVGGVARTVTVQATQALDLFDSVLSLGKADGVGSSLHHVAIWELAVAVRHTSAFEHKEFLSGQLQELGDSTRDVRDSIIKLNSLGLNSFTWIVHEFSRLEELIERMHSRPSAASRATLDHLLQNLYAKISDDLSSLLLALDGGITIADRASDLGGRLIGALSSEHAAIQREKEDVGVWQKLVDRQGWKGKQMKRDLQLASESVKGVKALRYNLERARSSFLEFSANVGNFKAGIIGYSISGHGLSAEDEIISLRNVLSDFRRTLKEAKGGREISGGRTAIEGPSVDAAVGSAG